MGFFDFFTDRTPAEPAEIRLVAFVSGKVQGEVLVEWEEPSGSFRGFGIR